MVNNPYLQRGCGNWQEQDKLIRDCTQQRQPLRCQPGIYARIRYADEIELTRSVASGVDEIETLGVELIIDL